MDDRVAEYVEHWLIKAGRDLRSASNDLKDRPPITDTVCYHSQQAVEKCLKAILAAHNQSIPRIHFLPRLLEEAARFLPGLLKFHTDAKSLAEYATSTRYPDDWREIPLSEATDAFKVANEIVRYVRQYFKGSSDDDEIITFAQIERDAVVEALVFTRGNVAAAARKLGISRGTFYKKLKEWGIDR